MRRRCRVTEGKDFNNYGKRGIKVCERWDEFANFLADMGLKPTPAHSIERIDNDGDYTPDNCKWETPKGQAQNKRHSGGWPKGKKRSVI